MTLASLHAAKGLEWDAVFLVGLADGTLPISHALSRRRTATGRGGAPAALRRRHPGHECIWRSVGRWRARQAGGRAASRRGSSTASPRRSLATPDPDRAAPQRGPTPRCRVCNGALTTPAAIMLRRCETCPSDIDEELLAELKEWRLRTSKEMRVPAYVVFTDNTLIAIAETLPTDDAALVAIPGIGARKLEQYGPDVLALVRSGPSPSETTNMLTGIEKIGVVSAAPGYAKIVPKPRSEIACGFRVSV